MVVETEIIGADVGTATVSVTYSQVSAVGDQTPVTTVIVETDGNYDDSTSSTVTQQLTTVDTYSETDEAQTSVTYETVATVDQTATVVGTTIVTDTDSVVNSEIDDAQTVTVSTTVIV